MAEPSSSSDPKAPESEEYDWTADLTKSLKESQDERNKKLKAAGLPTEQESAAAWDTITEPEDLPDLPPGMTYKDPDLNERVQEAQDGARAVGEPTFEELYIAKGLDPKDGRRQDLWHAYWIQAAKDTNEPLWKDNPLKDIPFISPVGHFLEETSLGLNVPGLTGEGEWEIPPFRGEAEARLKELKEGEVFKAVLPIFPIIMTGWKEAKYQDHKDSLIIATQPEDSKHYQRAVERQGRRQIQETVKLAEIPMWEPGGLWSAGQINPTMTEEELLWSATTYELDGDPETAEKIRKLALQLREFNTYLKTSLPDYEIPPIAIYTNLWGRGNGGGLDISHHKNALRRAINAERKREVGANETPEERAIWVEERVNRELGEVIGSHPVLQHWSIIDTDPYASKQQIMNRPEQWAEAMPGTALDKLARTAAQSWMPIEAMVRPTNLSMSTGLLEPEAVSAESILSWAVRLGAATGIAGAGAKFDQYPILGPWLKLMGDTHPAVRRQFEKVYGIDLSKSQKPTEEMIDWMRRGSDLGDVIPEYTEAVMASLFRNMDEYNLLSLVGDLGVAKMLPKVTPKDALGLAMRARAKQDPENAYQYLTTGSPGDIALREYEAFKDAHPFAAQWWIVVPSFVFEPDVFMALKPVGKLGQAAKYSVKGIKVARTAKSVGVISDLVKAIDEHVTTKLVGRMTEMTPDEAAAQREIVATMMHEGLKHPDILEEMKPAVMDTLLGLLHISETQSAGKLLEQEIQAMVRLKELAEEGDELIKVNQQLHTILAGFHARKGRLDIESTKARTALSLAHKFWGPLLSKGDLSPKVLKNMSRTDANRALNELVGEANRTRAMLENLQAKHADDITEESKLAAAVIENAKLLEELQALASKGLRNGDSVAWGKVGKEVAEAVEEAVPGAAKAEKIPHTDISNPKVGDVHRLWDEAGNIVEAIVDEVTPTGGVLYRLPDGRVEPLPLEWSLQNPLRPDFRIQSIGIKDPQGKPLHLGTTTINPEGRLVSSLTETEIDHALKYFEADPLLHKPPAPGQVSRVIPQAKARRTIIALKAEKARRAAKGAAKAAPEVPLEKVGKFIRYTRAANGAKVAVVKVGDPSQGPLFTKEIEVPFEDIRYDVEGALRDINPFYIPGLSKPGRELRAAIGRAFFKTDAKISGDSKFLPIDPEWAAHRPESYVGFPIQRFDAEGKPLLDEPGIIREIVYDRKTKKYFAKYQAKGAKGLPMSKGKIPLEEAYTLDTLVKGEAAQAAHTQALLYDAMASATLRGQGIKPTEEAIANWFVENIKGVTRAVSPEELEALVRSGQIDEVLEHANALRRGTETLKRFGIDPEKSKVLLREAAVGLQKRAVRRGDKVDPTDFSVEAEKKAAKYLVKEVLFELTPEMREGSGVGWYTANLKNALQGLGDIFSELKEGTKGVNLPGLPMVKTSEDARSVFSSLMGVTSAGQTVENNLRLTARIYDILRAEGPEGLGDIGVAWAGERQVHTYLEMIQEHGVAKTTKLLLEEDTVSNFRKQTIAAWKAAGSKGKKPKFAPGYKASAVLPRASGIFGEKLGIFTANLLGSTGHLTMDRWWVRTFNRYRGNMLQKPSIKLLNDTASLLQKEQGLEKLPTHEEVISMVKPYHDSYEAKKFKNGTPLETKSNTIYKYMFEGIQDSPRSPGEREFMTNMVKRAQKSLKRRGYDLSIADIQAIVWFYEKRLFKELGVRPSKDIGYAEAAATLVHDSGFKPSKWKVKEPLEEGVEGPGGVIVGAEGAGLKSRVQDLQEVDLDGQLKFLTQDDDGGVRPGVNLRQMLGLLGKSMYDKPLAEVVGKELLQNSFDAVKAAKAQGMIKEGEGLIDVIWDHEKREITFIDNGIGMVPETLGKAFFSPGGTMKTDLDISERSGGKGLAKMVFMFGTDSIEVATVRAGIRSEVKATSDEIMTAIEKGLALPTTTTKAEAGEHGTRVTVRVPETFTGADGTEKSIGFWKPNELVDSEHSIPLMGDVEVRSWDIHGSYEVTGPLWKQERLLPDNFNPDMLADVLSILPLGRRFSDEGGYQKVTDINFDWGKAEFWVHPEKTNYPRHHVLAAGVSQFTKSSYGSFLKIGNGPEFKHNVVLNLKPNVTAEHVHYPINNQREGFNPNIESDIRALARYVNQGIAAEQAKTTAEVFATATTMDRIDLADIAKPDPRSGGWFKAYEEPQAAPDITVLGIDISEGVATVTERVAGKKVTRKISEEGTKADESFKADVEAESSKQYFDSLSVDITKPLFHNNTNLEIPKEMQSFFAKMGSIVQMFREEVGSNLFRASSKYEDELGRKGTYASGISLDKEYHGVHVRVPYRAFFLNPLTNTNNTPRGAARSFYHTLVHEAVHLERSGHSEDFTVEFHRVLDELEDYEFPSRITNAFASILEENWNAFTKLRQQFDRYDTQNLAKSLEDGDSLPTKAPEGGVFGIIADTLETGGRAGGPGVGRGGVEAAGRVGGEAEPRSLDRVGEILEAVSSRRGVAPTKIPKGSKDVLYHAEEEAVPVFYSKLVKVIDDLPETKYTLSFEEAYSRKEPQAQVGVKIKGLINRLIKKGVKPSEIKASDLERYLEASLGGGHTHVRKAELEAWIDPRRLGVNLIDQRGPSREILQELETLKDKHKQARKEELTAIDTHLQGFTKTLREAVGADNFIYKRWGTITGLERHLKDQNLELRNMHRDWYAKTLRDQGPFTDDGFRFWLHDHFPSPLRVSAGEKRAGSLSVMEQARAAARDKMPKMVEGLLPSEDLLTRTSKTSDYMDQPTGPTMVALDPMDSWEKLPLFALLSVDAKSLPILFGAYRQTINALRKIRDDTTYLLEELNKTPEDKQFARLEDWYNEGLVPESLWLLAGGDIRVSRGLGPSEAWAKVIKETEGLIGEWSDFFVTKVQHRYQDYLATIRTLDNKLKAPYNETLQTLSKTEKDLRSQIRAVRAQIDAVDDAVTVPGGRERYKAQGSSEDVILLLQDKMGLGFNQSHGSHFEIDDIYGHIRPGVRLGLIGEHKGKRFLALDEVQADLFQQGKMRGYTPEVNAAKLEAKDQAIKSQKIKAEAAVDVISELRLEMLYLKGGFSDLTAKSRDLNTARRMLEWDPDDVNWQEPARRLSERYPPRAPDYTLLREMAEDQDLARRGQGETRRIIERIVSEAEARFAARGWPTIEEVHKLDYRVKTKMLVKTRESIAAQLTHALSYGRKLERLKSQRETIAKGPLPERFKNHPFEKIWIYQSLKRVARYAMDEGLDGLLIAPPKMPKEHSMMPVSAANQHYDKNLPNTLKKMLGLGKKDKLDEIQVSGWTYGDGPPPLKKFDDEGNYLLDAEGLSTRTGGLGVVFTDAHRAKFSKPLPLFQDKKAPKAAVSFAKDGSAIIYAFERADISSVLHETGHIWRRQLEKTPQGKADLESLYKWAGVKQDGVWTREAEEKFAKAFERYLREGKAPMASLHGAFAKFKLWLTEIYAKITNSRIDVEINKDVRAVFDRMITGDMTEEVLGKLKKVELQDIARANDLKVTTKMTKADLVNAILARQETRSARYKTFLARQETAGKAKRSNPEIVNARATLKSSKGAEKSITEKLVEPRKTLKAGARQLKSVGLRHTKLTNQAKIAERHQALSMLEAQSKENEKLIKATFKVLGIPIKDVNKIVVDYARQLTKTGFADNLRYATSKTLAIFEDYLDLLKTQQFRPVRRDLRQHPIVKGTRSTASGTIINKKKFFEALEKYYPKTTLDEFLRVEPPTDPARAAVDLLDEASQVKVGGIPLNFLKKAKADEVTYSPQQMKMLRDSLYEMESMFREGRLSQRAHGISRDILEYLRAPHGRGSIPVPFSNMLTATGVQVSGTPTRFFWRMFRAFNPDISRFGSMSKELALIAKRHERGRNTALGDLDSINQHNLNGDYFGEHVKYMDTHATMKGRYGWTNFNTWEGMSPFERARRFLMSNKDKAVKHAKSGDEEFISGLIARIENAFLRYGDIGAEGQVILKKKDIWKLLEDPNMNYKMFIHEIGLKVGATGTPSKQFLKGVVSASTAFIDAALMRETVMGINRSVNAKLTPAEADGVIKLMSGPQAASKIDDIDAMWVGFNKLGMFSKEVTLRPGRLSGEGEKRLSKKLVSFALDDSAENIVLPGHLVEIASRKSAKYTMELDKMHSPEISTGALRALQKVWSLWKAHKTTGLILPRPKYYMNNLVGDFSQIWWNFGILKASKLTTQNALTNIPIIGTPMQNAVMKMSERMEGVPVLGPMMNAMFNPNVSKIFMAEDDLIRLTPNSTPIPVAVVRQRLAQDGVLDSVVHEELMTATRKQGNIMFSQAETTMARHGKPLLPKVRAMLKRHLVDDLQNFAANVQQRQRVGLYLDMRAEGKTHKEAVEEVMNALYDWTHGLSTTELNTFMNINIPFYRWFRLSLGQSFRALMEPFVTPTSEYLPKALIGQTKMGRARTQGQLLALWPRWSAELNNEELEEQEQAHLFYATMVGKSWWLKPGHSYSGYRPSPRVQEGYLLNEGRRPDHITQVMSAPMSAAEITAVPMIFISAAYGLGLAALDPTYEFNMQRTQNQIQEAMEMVAGPILEDFIAKDKSREKWTRRISPGEKAALDFLSSIPGFKEMANVRYDKENRLVANDNVVWLIREFMPVLGNILPDIVTGWQRSSYHTNDNFKKVWDTFWHTAGPVRDYPTELGKSLEWTHKDLEEILRLRLDEHRLGKAPTEVWIRPSDEASEEDR